MNCPHCDGTGSADSGGFTPWGEPISIPCPACNENTMTVNLNGKTITVPDGSSVSITNGEIIVNGKRWEDGEYPRNANVVVNVDGNTGNLNITGSVKVSGKADAVVAGGSADIGGDVGGNVNANGSVECKAVTGNVQAGGSVRCGAVTGSIKAGGSVRHG